MIGSIGIDRVICSDSTATVAISMSVMDPSDGEDTSLIVALDRRQRLALTISLIRSLLHR